MLIFGKKIEGRQGGLDVEDIKLLLVTPTKSYNEKDDKEGKENVMLNFPVAPGMT